jgi:hypothetical protein
MAAGLALGMWLNWFPTLVLLALYALAAVGFTMREMIRPAAAPCRLLGPLLPGVFFLLHVTYGIGTISGLVAAPWFLYANRNHRVPWPIEN